METVISSLSQTEFESNIPGEIIAEQEAEHRRELRKLSDLAFTFLTATEGNPEQAEELFDNAIDLLFEGGTLSTWRYRIVQQFIREGL